MRATREVLSPVWRGGLSTMAGFLAGFFTILLSTGFLNSQGGSMSFVLRTLLATFLGVMLAYVVYESLGAGLE